MPILFTAHDRSSLTRRIAEGEAIHAMKKGWRYQLALLPPVEGNPLAPRIAWGVCVRRRWSKGVESTVFAAASAMENATRRKE